MPQLRLGKQLQDRRRHHMRSRVPQHLQRSLILLLQQPQLDILSQRRRQVHQPRAILTRARRPSTSHLPKSPQSPLNRVPHASQSSPRRVGSAASGFTRATTTAAASRGEMLVRNIKRGGPARNLALRPIRQLDSNLFCAHALQNTASAASTEGRRLTGLLIRIHLPGKEAKRSGLTQFGGRPAPLHSFRLRNLCGQVLLRGVATGRSTLPLAFAHTCPRQMPIRGAPATTTNA